MLNLVIYTFVIDIIQIFMLYDQYDICWFHMYIVFSAVFFRCKRWVQLSRRDDLRKMSTEYLHANCKLCADHFEQSQFMNSVLRNKLVWNAVPSIFSVPSPPKKLVNTWKSPLKRHCTESALRIKKKARYDGLLT